MATSQKRDSVIWKHVSAPSGGKVVCNYCKREFKFGGATSNIRGHLIQNHRPQVERDFTAEAPAAAASASQPSLKGFMALRKPYAADSREQRERAESFVRYIVDNKLAPYQVEKESTKLFFNLLDPRFSIPCRKTIISKLLPTAVARLKQHVIEQLHSAYGISLTLDLWTEKRQPYLVVNAHCTTKDHTYDTFCLTFERVPESHTAANLLVRVLEATTAMIPHPHKIVALTTNTTSNVKRLGHDSPWLWIPCVNHVFSLSVHDAIDSPAFTPAIVRARALATSFRDVQRLSMGLEARQALLHQHIKPLVLDVATRWNSLYLMLQRLVEQQSIIRVVLAETNDSGKNLTTDEWALVEELLKILEPFYSATVLLSTQRHVCMSVVAPLIYSISSVTSPTASALSHDLSAAISRRLLPLLEPTSMFRHACALDPRLKGHRLHDADAGVTHDVWHFISVGAASYAAVMPALDTPPGPADPPVVEGPAPDPSTPAPAAATPAAQSASTKKRARCEELVFAGVERHAQVGVMPIDAQLLSYRSQAAAPRDVDPLLWWKERARDLPTLHAYAMRILCIQPTEVAAERAFSWAGQFFDDGRASMSDQSLSDYMFIFSNDPLLKRAAGEAAEPD